MAAAAVFRLDPRPLDAEAKGVQAIVGAVAKPGRDRTIADQLHGFGGFRIVVQEGFHFGRIGFARRRVRRRGKQLIVKSLGGLDREDGYVVHARAPLFAIGQLEKNCHAAHRFWRIGDEGLTSRQRKPSNDWHSARMENRGFRQRHAAAVTLKVTADADSLGMIATEAGMRSVHLFERVDHRCRRECVRRNGRFLWLPP